jgi:autotransporter-associated beta strand protein
MKKNYTQISNQHNHSFLRGLLPPKGWMVLVLFMIFSVVSVNAQQEVTWRSEAANGDWQSNQADCEANGSGSWWFTTWASGRRAPDCFTDDGNHVKINNNVHTSMTLNAKWFNVNTLEFQSGASTARTIAGSNGIDLKGERKIINNSTASHTFSAPVAINSGAAELNPVNGDLTFSGTIDNKGNNILVYGSNALTLSGVVSGSGSIFVEQNVSLTLSAAHTYTGQTLLKNGTLTLGATNALPVGSGVGTLRTEITSGRVINLGNFGLGTSTAAANSAGDLDFDTNTTINLGNSGSHQYFFKASNGQTWDATTITINNWTGSAGATGTSRKIFVGSTDGGLTTAQLDKINFNGYGTGATLLSTGELVPRTTDPAITVSTTSLTAFANTCPNATSANQTFTVSGTNLTANITVTAPTDFQVSTSSGSGFGSSVTLTQSGGTVSSTTIYARFAPGSVGAKSGNITATSTGATTRNVSVSGTGDDTVGPTYTYLRTLTATVTINQGSNATIEGEGYADGFTNGAGQAAGSTVEFGYKNANTNPTSDGTWTWATATFDRQNGNNDLFRANNFGSALAPGTYYYTFRFKLTDCSAWQYAGTNTDVWNNNSGVLTVTGPAITGAKLGVKFNGGGPNWGFAGLQDACEDAIDAWQGKNLGSMPTSGTLVLDGANVFTNTTGSTNGILYYRVYKDDATPPDYDTFNIGSTQTNCGSSFKYENATDFTIPSSKYGVVGTYHFDVYYEITNGGTLSQGSAGSPYRATFTTTPASNNHFYSDRIFFRKNGTETVHFLELNNPRVGTACAEQALAPAENAWNGADLGDYISGQVVQLGGYLISKGIQNSNTPFLNYKIYPTGTNPDLVDWISTNFNHVSDCNADNVNECDNSNDKVWNKPYFNISIPGEPGDYDIQIFISRQQQNCGGGNDSFLNRNGQNYTATITTVKPSGIFSSKAAVKIGTKDMQWYAAGGHDETCDPGSVGNYNNTTVQVLSTEQIVLAGNFIADETQTGATLYYRIYPVGGSGGSFTAISLSTHTTPCSSNKYENATGSVVAPSGTLNSGTYVLEIYFEGNTLVRNNNGNNYIMYLNVSDGLDGNLNPTGTHISGIFETYIAQLILELDDDGNPDPTKRVISRVFDLDGSFGSSNPVNFDLGTTAPGIEFTIGMEAKVFTKETIEPVDAAVGIIYMKKA